MKIGIDARFFGPKVGGGGLGRYVKELLDNLQETKTQDRFIVFLNKEGYDAFNPTNPNFEKRLAPIRWYSIAEQMLMPRIVDKENLDLMHYPHWNVPIFAKTPFVVTIHDLILLEEKDSARRATTLPRPLYNLKYLGYKFVLKHALAKSKHIVAISEFTKVNIEKNFPFVPEDKISVVYEGVSLIKATDSDAKTQVPDSPYFLYVGNAFPHKNLESLLHAFSLFYKMHPEVKLVLVGKTDFFYKRLQEELEEIEIPNNSVIFTGFIPDEELAHFYKHATLYVFPSLHEGFGLPPLEAMAHGVPVAASRRTALPEILGDAALYFDPNDIEEMIRVMETALSDESLRNELSEKGLEKIKDYSWETMAKEMLSIYGEQGR